MLCEGHALTAVEASMQLSKEMRSCGLVVDDTDRVRIRSARPTILIIDHQGPLESPAARDHCMQFMVAIILIKVDLPKIEDKTFLLYW